MQNKWSKCPYCGERVASRDKFCMDCGGDLMPPPPSSMNADLHKNNGNVAVSENDIEDNQLFQTIFSNRRNEKKRELYKILFLYTNNPIKANREYKNKEICFWSEDFPIKLDPHPHILIDLFGQDKFGVVESLSSPYLKSAPMPIKCFLSKKAITMFEQIELNHANCYKIKGIVKGVEKENIIIENCEVVEVVEAEVGQNNNMGCGTMVMMTFLVMGLLMLLI